MNSIAVLMTCHNRRAKTLACLEALQRSAEGIPETDLHVFLTDDGCTDGTAEAVTVLDSSITIVTGSGDLYWNRGMIAAWRAAEAASEEFDGFLLLNDDTMVDSDCMNALTSVSRELSDGAIVIGAVRAPDTGELTYGGIQRLSSWHPGRTRRLEVSDRIQDADTFNANCVLVPAAVHRSIGTLDPGYTHAMGDFDYGLRAKAAGYRVVVAPGTIGSCERNDSRGSWLDIALPLNRRLKLLGKPKGLPRTEWERYLHRHGAPLARLLSYAPRLKLIASWLARRAVALLPLSARR